MPPQARVGDNAFNPADAHGCPACPHPVTGPGQSGSPNITVNGKAAMRKTDPGTHSACCGPNSWVVKEGSSTVYFNNLPAARLTDPTTHCGGTGSLIVGSTNLNVGG